MMRRAHKFSFICFAVLAALIAVIFACAFVQADLSVAVADSLPHFTISTDDGNLWILSQEEAEIGRFEGRFLDIIGNDAAGEFYAKISSVLEEAGKDDYELDFKLPDIGCVAEGGNTFEYSENRASGFTLRAVYQPLISTTVNQSLEYKTADGQYRSYAFSTSQNGGLSFGQGVDVGEYDVRIVVYEIVVFDGKTYNVPRYSPARGCTISKATPVAPDVEPLSVEYGTLAKDIANAIPTVEGTWALSARQTDSAITDGNSRLHVKEEAYKVNFDFTPHNKNYNTLKEVALDVTVSPRTLRVYISDAYSLVGEPLVRDFSYEIATPLVDGDREEDLGIELVCEGLDANIAGDRIIVARFESKDYIPYSLNYNNMFLNGGKYSVYATREAVSASDGAVFYVMLSEGFRNMTVRIEPVADPEFDGLAFVAGYRFIFENESGTRIFPEQDFTVAWDDGSIVADSYVIALSDGTQNSAKEMREAFITAPKNTDAIMFFVVANGADPMRTACIALAGVCGVLGVTLIVLVIVYFARRRYFK